MNKITKKPFQYLEARAFGTIGYVLHTDGRLRIDLPQSHDRHLSFSFSLDLFKCRISGAMTVRVCW